MKAIYLTKAFQPLTTTFKIIVAIYIFKMSLFSPNLLHGQSSSEKPGIFYAITRNGLTDTSWLFGTYHLVNSSYLDELPAVQNAYKKTKGLVVEIVMDSSKMQEAQAMGLMKDNTLSALLGQPFSDSLETELKNAIGVGLSQMNQLKPITVTLTLSIIYLMKNNNKILKQYTGLPLDAHFVQEGKISGKHITALETIKEQMDLLFNRLPEVEQADQLKSFLRNRDQMISLGDRLLQSWFSHDLKELYAIYEQARELSGEEDYLITARNNKWMKILPGLVNSEPHFIAVGALHLAGPDGLVKQLQQLGYTLTPIK